MKNFQHFVITRFNLDLYAWDKNRIPTRTEKWLQHRFDIFEQYCLPSMQAQTEMGRRRKLPSPHLMCTNWPGAFQVSRTMEPASSTI